MKKHNWYLAMGGKFYRCYSYRSQLEYDCRRVEADCFGCTAEMKFDAYHKYSGETTAEKLDKAWHNRTSVECMAALVEEADART